MILVRPFLLALMTCLVIAGCETRSEVGPPEEKPAAELSVGETRVEYEAASKAYKENKTEETESKFVAATVRHGTAVMTGDGDPTVKYPRALELYDEALAVDPENLEAKTNKQIILDIYKSLNREPPKTK